VKSVRFHWLAAGAVALLAISCSKQEAAVEQKAGDKPKEVSLAAKPGWLTSYDQAQKEAQAQHKLLLMDFTGSDWCGWCMKLNKEVFSQPQFKDYAGKALVLLEVDFPRQKAQSAETRKQNQELAQQYQVEGFPTLVVLNGDGRKLWQYDGYFADGPAAFIAQLEKLRKG
jgi:thioredoxin-related protein